MANNKVMVTSKVDSTVIIDLPELKMKRAWTKKGMTLPIDKDALAEAIYDPSVEFLMKEGVLFIEDLAVKKELGLELETATEATVEIINLTDALMKRIINGMPQVELNSTLEKLSASQKSELANYAIEHYSELSMDRADLLSKACGKNIIRSIENMRAADEEVKPAQ